MKNVMGILGLVGKIFLYVVLVLGSLVSMLVAYTLFAPDTMPKPFHMPTSAVVVSGEGSGESVPSMASTAEPTEEPTQPGSGVMIDTGTKIINLAEPNGNKYIRIDVVLEFAQPPELTSEAKAAPKEGEGETAVVTAAQELTNQINARLPLINDTVITLLSSKSFEELYTATGKEALRGELMQKLQALIPEYQLIGVYFTEFVVE
jgi:flagellar basal body-associated protein FliL